jgi:hypothetical protein
MYTAYVYYVFANHTGFYENNYSIERWKQILKQEILLEDLSYDVICGSIFSISQTGSKYFNINVCLKYINLPSKLPNNIEMVTITYFLTMYIKVMLYILLNVI